MPYQVVIIGGGFGGLSAALALKRIPVRVTLLDRRNFHLFQPLLYQVATGGLSPANIAAPLREILKHQPNTQVLLADVVGIDVANRTVQLDRGHVAYDILVIAAGTRHDYFGKDHWQHLAPGLKTVEDATRIRRKILFAFEAAERETDPTQLQAWLTFVVVGAGPTGVELAGAIAELANDTLKHNFRAINPSIARVILLEGTDRVLPSYPLELSHRARKSLEYLRVQVRTSAIVTDIRPGRLIVQLPNQTETVTSHTVLWAAGVQASYLGQVLAQVTGCSLDRIGRVIVEPDLSVPRYPAIFVIGDLAHVTHQSGRPLPGLAPVAMQEGRYVANVIQRRLRDLPSAPFRYADRGTMATIGRRCAVADLGWVHLAGLPAWLAWLFIHLMGLVTFQNRLLVLIQWAWNYVTFNRAARLITEDNSLTLDRAKERLVSG